MCTISWHQQVPLVTVNDDTLHTAGLCVEEAEGDVSLLSCWRICKGCMSDAVCMILVTHIVPNSGASNCALHMLHPMPTSDGLLLTWAQTV